jgi:PleD family two-component response regulator
LRLLVERSGVKIGGYGGEELIVVMPIPTPKLAIALAQGIRKEVKGFEIGHDERPDDSSSR